MTDGFIEQTRARGLLAQITHEDVLRQHLAQAPRVGYAGFDPTADSLHVGHLLPVMMLARWQRAGHCAIALMGGGTAMIGDPTGKSEMRQMLALGDIDKNIAKIKIQIGKFIDLSDAKRGLIVNNADWLRRLNYLDVLREVGPHFSVNRMLTADCFKTRLEKGLSFIEFNYMILQSYDFLHLFRAHNCTVQVGGDDQWSNMLGGVDLIRRLNERAQSFCMTFPLFATSDGRKMGKTEKGAVWLDAEKTSPYEYYQFWRNIPDELVTSSLYTFTFLPDAEVRELATRQGAQINEVKKLLAFETTKLLHGEPAATAAQASAAALFGAGGGTSGSEPEFLLPRESFAPGGLKVIDALMLAKAFASKGEIRRLIEQGGLVVNDRKIGGSDDMLTESDFADPKGCLIRKGKKHYFRLRFSP